MKTTKAQRKAAVELARDIEKANTARIIRTVSRETAIYCAVLNSDSYGELEAWNLATCWIQNAESDGNELAAHVECALSYESKEVAAYFHALGIKF